MNGSPHAAAISFTSAKAALLSPQPVKTDPIYPFRSARAAQLEAATPAVGGAAKSISYFHTFTLTIRGLQHHRETGALTALNATGAHLCLAREPDNEHDVNAVAVNVGQCKLGYVAKEQAVCLAPFLDEGSCAAPLVRVERVALASPLPREREEANAGGDDAMEVVKQEQVEEAADNEQLTERHSAGNVLIKPSPNVAPTSPPFSPAPIPTSLTIIVHAVVQQESIFLALQQAFPPPPQSPGALAALEEEKVQAERDRLLGLLAAAHGKIEREGRTGLRVLSLFDGIGAALVALLKESCPIALYCSSEIEEDALEVMEAHYLAFNGNDNDSQGQQPQGFLHVSLGDVRLIDERMIELIQPDLIIGGSPSQDLSRMNMKGKGLEGDRSKLFFEFIRVRDLCLASSKGQRGELAIMLENVVPREESQTEAMNRHMQLAPIRLNASEVSAAGRDRLYWTNLPTHGLTPSPASELSGVLVSGRPAFSLPGNLTAEGKACCIVRTAHRDFNLIEDPIHPLAITAGSRYRPLLPIEEERLLGFDDNYTRVGGLTDAKRHALLGNSFSIPVVRQILRRLKKLAEAKAEEERTQAIAALNLLAVGSAAATRFCSNCSSRVCVCL